MSCWDDDGRLEIAAICFIRSIEAIVAARSKLKLGDAVTLVVLAERAKGLSRPLTLVIHGCGGWIWNERPLL
jgi:hypothetical protein